jgi:hypothetical protein
VDEAQQLEDKLEVAMARVPSVRGEGDTNIEDAIKQILRTGRTTVS